MKLRPIEQRRKNKRGQAESIIVFFVLIVAIFIVSIVVLRIVNEIVSPFATQLNSTSIQASQAVTYTQNKFTSFWDTAIIILFAINVILLLVSAFLVDVHPAFILIYIIAIIFLFIFGNYALYALDSIWNKLATATEINQTPMQQFIINHFQTIMLGIVILSGIVMYSKIRFFSQGTGIGGNY